MAMRVRLALLCFLIAAFGAGSANACMQAHLPLAALFDRPPSALPPNAVVMKVASLGRDPRDPERMAPRLVVRVVDEAQARRYGRVVLLRFSYGSSCTGWGRENGNAYAVVRPVGQIGGRTLLEAAVYGRSWLDGVFRAFGRETCLASGAPVEGLE